MYPALNDTVQNETSLMLHVSNSVTRCSPLLQTRTSTLCPPHSRQAHISMPIEDWVSGMYYYYRRPEQEKRCEQLLVLRILCTQQNKSSIILSFKDLYKPEIICTTMSLTQRMGRVFPASPWRALLHLKQFGTLE